MILNLLAQTYNSSYGAYNDSYSASTTGSDAAAGLAAITIIMIVLLIVAAFWIPMIIGMWKIFEKAGEKGWKALIPIYGSWVLFEVSGKPGYWALAGFIPFVGNILSIVASVVAMLQLAKNFGKDNTFAILWLIIFPFVGLIRLGFGNAQYLGPNVSDAGTTTPGPTPLATPSATDNTNVNSPQEIIQASAPSPVAPQNTSPPQPPAPTNPV